MSKPTTERIRGKRYRCKECGHEKEIDTNHYGECYSWGGHNTCPQCPPYKRPNTWVCMETPPEGMERPPKWTKAVIEVGSVENNCDGSGPHIRGEVRVLPTGGDGNSILCRACFDREIRYRRDRNRQLGKDCQFKLPTWEECKVYGKD